MAHTPSPEERAAQVREAIHNAEKALERGQRFFEEHGLDSEKAHAFLSSKMDEKAQTEARRQFEQDMRDIDQEVHEQAAREASLNAAPSAPRRHRPMI
ncbi:hypothetical protein [Comamonas flocculans]|uniref:Uncharacterized protein n=1 Tax=Comamonas flocculans TaxID=2597701 RepID=A0A5B8RUH9_9BURK|nr:hypothetical protein [Comamonas flocculans]QEA13171.1 hypothetical protein FOZ74_09080 [Comamonas flocculans]